MACLIDRYNNNQGAITKAYVHELCKHLRVPSPYKYEFETHRIDYMEYNPFKPNKRKNKEDEWGF